MKNKILIIFSFVLFHFGLSGQIVDHYTGHAVTPIPLYTLDGHHVDLPVSLMYTSNGFRPDDLASDIGLGWNLDYGGSIVREVKGLPDDYHSYLSGSIGRINVGYLYNGDAFKEDAIVNGINSSYHKRRHLEGSVDLEPDVFHFTAGKYSGSFVFDSFDTDRANESTGSNQKVEPIFFSESDVKIDYTLDKDFDYSEQKHNGPNGVWLDNPGQVPLNFVVDSPARGALVEFVITTPEGDKYTYSKKKIVFTKTPSQRLDQSSLEQIDNDCGHVSMCTGFTKIPQISREGCFFQTRDWSGVTPNGDDYANTLSVSTLEDDAEYHDKAYANTSDVGEVGYIVQWYLTKIENSLGFVEFEMSYEPYYHRNHSKSFLTHDHLPTGKTSETLCDYTQYSNESYNEFSFIPCYFEWLQTLQNVLGIIFPWTTPITGTISTFMSFGDGNNIFYNGGNGGLIPEPQLCFENNTGSLPAIPENVSTSINETTLDWRLTNIAYKNYGLQGISLKHNLEFIYADETREDLFYRDADNHPAMRAKRLKEVKNFRFGNLKNNYELVHGYFQNDIICEDFSGALSQINPISESHEKRLKLRELILKSPAESVDLTQYFDYHENTADLKYPARHTLKKDLWGFYNKDLTWQDIYPTLYINSEGHSGGLNGSYGSMYSPFLIDGSEDMAPLFSGDRVSDDASMKLCMLRKITNTYGGYTEIEYEPHEFSFEGVTYSGGGLRVSSLNTSDNNGSGGTKSFSYNNSGKLLRFPTFASFQLESLNESSAECTDINNGNDGTININIPDPVQETLLLAGTLASSSAVNNTDNGVVVGYSSVTETSAADGGITYDFDLTFYADARIDEIGNSDVVSLVNNMFPIPSDINSHDSERRNWSAFAALPNTNWYNRSPLRVTYKNVAGEIVQEVENQYEVIDFKHVTGLKALLKTNLENEFYANCNYALVNPSTPTDCDFMENPWDLANDWRLIEYRHLSGNKKLVSSKVTYKGENGVELETITDFEYGDSHLLPILVSTTDSEGLTRETETKYTTEATGQVILGSMVDRNILYRPIEIVSKKDGIIIGGLKTDYTVFSIPFEDVQYIVPQKIYSRYPMGWNVEIELPVGTYNRFGFPAEVHKPHFDYTYLDYNLTDGSLNYKQDNKSWTGDTDYYETSYDYDEFGMLERITDPNNQSFYYHYDGFGRKDEIKSKNDAVVTSISYDIGQGGGNSILYSTDYGDDDTNATETQELRRHVDGLGRVLSNIALSHTPQGSDKTVSSYAYDSFGRKASIGNYQNGGVSYTFDGSPLSRVKVVSPAGPRDIKYVHDVNDSTINGYAAGELKKLTVTDENENSTTVYSDKVGRTILKEDELGGQTSYFYDTYDRLSRIESPAGEFVYGYDGKNRLSTKTVPGAEASNYHYNNRDELVLMVDANLSSEGRCIVIEYDDLSRPTRTGFSNFPTDYTIDEVLTVNTYDEGSGASIGKLTNTTNHVIDPEGDVIPTDLATTINYDSYGRVVGSDVGNFEAPSDSYIYTLDNADKLTDLSRIHGEIVFSQDYIYDHAGRANTQTTELAGVADANITSTTGYTYGDRDFMINKNLGQGLQNISYGYNARGWMTNINGIDKYAEVQNLIPTCGQVGWEGDCFADTDEEPTPLPPYCGECGDTEISLPELLEIRQTDEDISLNCYQSCECDNNKDYIDDNGQCVQVQPECTPFERQSQKESLQYIRNSVAPAAVDYPFNLYRVRLCGGEEVYIPQSNMPDLEGQYVTTQDIYISNAEQNIFIDYPAGGGEYITAEQLLSGYIRVPSIKLDYYEPCGIAPKLGAKKSIVSDCNEHVRVNAESVSGSSLLSTILKEKCSDFTTEYPGSENSLVDDDVDWTIIGSHGQDRPDCYEVAWDIPYTIPEDNFVLNNYKVHLDAHIYTTTIEESAYIRFALHDGNGLVQINNGQNYISISEDSNFYGLDLVPDQLPTDSQMSQMKVIMLVQYSFLRWIKIDAVQVILDYDVFPCREMCVTTNDIPSSKVTGSAIYAKALGLNTEDLTAAVEGSEKSLVKDGDSWRIEGGYLKDVAYEAKWILPYEFGEGEDGLEVEHYAVNFDMTFFDVTRGKVVIGLFDGESFIKVNGGQEYLGFSAGSTTSTELILNPDETPTKEQIKNMQVAILIQAPFDRMILIDGVSAEIKYKAPCELEECEFLKYPNAKSVGDSKVFGELFDRESGSLVETFLGSEHSLTDDGQTWDISSPSPRNKMPLEAAWDLGFTASGWQNATITDYSVDIDIPRSLLSSQNTNKSHLYLGLHDGDNFVKINDGQEYLKFSSTSNGSTIGYQIIEPDEMPLPQQMARMKLVIMISHNFTRFASIEVVSPTIKYTIKQCNTDPCEAVPICSDEEIFYQKESLRRIREMIAETTIENLPIPNTLHRIQLCNGEELNLFQHELDLLEGNFLVLDVVEIPTETTTVLVPSDGPVKSGSDEYIDLFAEQLKYWGKFDDMESTRQYNGNISAAKWQVAGQSIKGYSYDYDDINRLKRANFSEFYYDYKNEVCQSSTNGRYSVGGNDDGIRYDAAGNIENIWRNGVTGHCANGFEFGKIDDIFMDRSDNQLSSVREKGDFNHGFKTDEFLSGGYEYDDNGNMTYDPSKKITILYNYMNKPRKITKEGSEDELLFWYDTGGKLIKTELSGGNSYTKKQVGGFEYIDGTLKAVYHDDGRFIIPEEEGEIKEVITEYVIRDHLGNARISFADLDADGLIEVGYEDGAYTEITQENHFYPFGMKMEGNFAPIALTENEYQYNGMQSVDDMGLDVNLTFYRVLDPALGSWWQIDPAVDKYHSLTPYNSMFNSPIVFVDPLGDDPTTIILTTALTSLGGAITGAFIAHGNGSDMGKGALRGALIGAAVGFTVSMVQAGGFENLFAGGGEGIGKAIGETALAGVRTATNTGIKDFGGDGGGNPISPFSKQDLEFFDWLMNSSLSGYLLPTITVQFQGGYSSYRNNMEFVYNSNSEPWFRNKTIEIGVGEAFGGGMGFSLGIVWDDQGDWGLYANVDAKLGLESGVGITVHEITPLLDEGFKLSMWEGRGINYAFSAGFMGDSVGYNIEDWWTTPNFLRTPTYQYITKSTGIGIGNMNINANVKFGGSVNFSHTKCWCD